MNTTATKIQDERSLAALTPYEDAISKDLDQDSYLNSGVFEQYLDTSDQQKWSDKLGNAWQCIVADYSVQYKFLPERFHPLHTNQFAIDYQILKEVGAYKIIEITRCSYEVHESQNVRVSVQAKFIFAAQHESKIAV